MDITVKELYKSYGDKPVLQNFSADFKDGKVSVVMGKSGSGKTTLLNCIAGLTPFEGEVSGVKRAAYVFQQDRLIPHMSIYGNLEITLRDSPEVKSEKIKNVLRAVDLTDKAHKLPSELSGGERKRAALSRAFLSDADVILLDEPLNSLDVGLKRRIDDYFLEMIKNDKKSAIYVTHDLDEALFIADEITVIIGGKPAYVHAFSSTALNRDITSDECVKVRRELLRLLY